MNPTNIPLNLDQRPRARPTAVLGKARKFLVEGRRLQEAEDELTDLLESLLTSHPEIGEAFLLRREVRIATGNSSGARKDLEMLLYMSPSHEEATRLLSTSPVVSLSPLRQLTPRSSVAGSSFPAWDKVIKSSALVDPSPLLSKISPTTHGQNDANKKLSWAEIARSNSQRWESWPDELDNASNQDVGPPSDPRRVKLLERLKAIEDVTTKRTEALRDAKSHAIFKTIAQADARIKHNLPIQYLLRSIHSGRLGLGDERRALAELSTAKQARLALEGFEMEQAAVDAERVDADKIRQQLHETELVPINGQPTPLKADLGPRKSQNDEAYSGSNEIEEAVDLILEEIHTAFPTERSDHTYGWHVDSNEYARRNLQRRALAAISAAREIREMAQTPAYEHVIKDCLTLLDHFSARNTTPSVSSLGERRAVAGVTKLQLRQVEQRPIEGLVALKKKGEEEPYFIMPKREKGNKSMLPAPHMAGAIPEASGGITTTNPTAKIQLPLHIITKLTETNIPLPTSAADLPRLIEDVRIKKAWFEANEALRTRENIANAQRAIRRLIFTVIGEV